MTQSATGNSTRGTKQVPKPGRPARPVLALGAMAILLIALGVWWSTGGSAPPAAESATSQADGPRLAVQQDVVDLGTQPFDRRVSAAFDVRNVGSSPLRIQDEPVVEIVEGC